MVVLLVVIQEFYCANTREYTNIPFCRGKLVFDSSRLQEGICVDCTIKLTNRIYGINVPVSCVPLFEKIYSIYRGITALRIVRVLANSEVPDETPYNAAFYLVLHCLPNDSLRSH